MDVESYYDFKEKEESNKSIFSSILDNPNTKKLIIVLAIIILIIIFFLFFSLPQNPDKKLKISSNNDDIAFSGSLSVNGELVETFASSGRTIIDTVNPNERGRVILSLGNSDGLKLDNPRVVITTGDGLRLVDIPSEYIIINPDGTLSFTIDFTDLSNELGLDFIEGQEYEFILQVTFTSDDESQVLTLEIPYIVNFSEFSGEGCLLVNKSNVSASIQKGLLETPIKIKINCDSYQDLFASVNWKSEVLGNVEIIFSNNQGSILIPDNLKIYSAPNSGQYDAIIYYVPNSNALGKVSDFSVSFYFEGSVQKIDFLVNNTDLEQCVSVKVLDDVIENDSDSASIMIDARNCSAQKINFLLCDNDPGCSGGADGSISLSDNAFFLSESSPTKTININRNEIPGLYGVSVHAQLPGMDKVFLSEKEIFVKPTNELVFPTEFSVSLMGSNDSVRIKNNSLSQDVTIDTSICNLYESSLGINPQSNSSNAYPITGSFSDSKEWINDLLNNKEKYSGRGFYESSFYSILPLLSNVSTTAYYIAVEENAKIKLTYLWGKNLSEPLNELIENSDKALEELTKVNDELAKVNQNSDIQLASQMAGLVTSLTSLYGDYLVLKTSVSTAATSVQTTSTSIQSSCIKASAGMTTASTAMNEATSTSFLLYSEGLQVLNSARDLYSLYQQIDSLSKNSQTMDAQSALENSVIVNEKLKEISDKMISILEYLDLALKSASIDSLDFASSGHYESKQYLELALDELNDIELLKNDILEAQLNANDDLTVIGDDLDEKTQLIIEGSKLALDLIEQTGLLTAKLELIRDSVITAIGGLDVALAAASADCTCAETQAGRIAGCQDGCCAAIATINLTKTKLLAVQSEITTSYSSTLKIIGTINTIYNSWQFYESLTADYYGNLMNTFDLFSAILEDLYDFELNVFNAITDFGLGVDAAQNLSILEKESSNASAYSYNSNILEKYGSFNDERLSGLIGTMLSSSFITGAYDGGVYNTKQSSSTNAYFNSNLVNSNLINSNNIKLNFSNLNYDIKPNINSKKALFSNEVSILKEDCDNQVKLTLPAYKINLLNDAKPIELSSPQVIAQWSFNDLEVFDVFNEQEASIIFSKAGLKKNSYVTIHIPVKVRNYSDLEKIDSLFSPFDIPSNDISEEIYSFQMKVNVLPRKETIIPNINTPCQNNLLFGETGKNVLPKIILGWDWNDISEDLVKDNYLDSTQFSILVSKKLSALNSELSNITTSCPENYAFNILKQITPKEFKLPYLNTCFIPLTTWQYDNKPALYYYLNNSTTEVKDTIVDLLDFEVNLMRDGLGLEFQSDFVDYYTKTFLKASPEFVDPQDGMNQYFKNSKKFYFTNETLSFKPEYDFIISDAGKYNIKTIINFDQLPLISGGATTSKIFVDVSLKEPINSNYSPFYYTPFNGGVGLRNDNDRRYYGTSIDSGSSLQVSFKEPALLENNQVDSLVKINSQFVNDFYLLNSFASKRGKIMDYSFINSPKTIFSPTIATPIIFSLIGQKGSNVILNYEANKNEKRVPVKMNNLLLLSGIDNCNDFFGNNLKSYINQVPDFVMGQGHGFGFNEVKNSGKTGLTTIIYSPINDNYALNFNSNQTIISSNNSLQNGLLYLTGVNGMNNNNFLDNDYINSIKSLFESVENESVCITRFGNRELFWWSEKMLFAKNDSNGKSLNDNVRIIQQDCLK